MPKNSSKDNSLGIYSIPRTVMVVRKTLETTFGFALQVIDFIKTSKFLKPIFCAARSNCNCLICYFHSGMFLEEIERSL